ncbi:MAG: NifB/NifX family molybdenum-iron cluster-binding protein [Thermoplasmata archaeon]
MRGSATPSAVRERICVTSVGPSPDDLVDPRFGRCAYFLITEAEGENFRPVENTARGLGNGAGIQAAQTLANMAVDVVLTGDLGPNAFRVLSEGGIRAFRVDGVPVRKAVEEYLRGRLVSIDAPTTHGHHGRGGFGPRWK